MGFEEAIVHNGIVQPGNACPIVSIVTVIACSKVTS